MRKAIFKLVLIMSFFLSVTVGAAPILIQTDGKYTGATGVEINNVTYDVTFLDGVFSDIFFGDSWTPFSSEADVFQANSQLHALIMADENLNLDPSLTTGCSSSSFCWIFSPIASRSDDGTYEFGRHNLLDSYLRSAVSSNGSGLASVMDYEGAGDSPLIIDTNDWAGMAWAKWSVTSVPEPSTLALLCICLLILMARRVRLSR